MCIRDRDNSYNRILPAIWVYGRIRSIVQQRERSIPSDAYTILRRKNGTEPVSYTHLDVYKRQLFYHFFPVILYSKKAEILSVDNTGVYSKTDGTGIRDMPIGIG